MSHETRFNRLFIRFRRAIPSMLVAAFGAAMALSPARAGDAGIYEFLLQESRPQISGAPARPAAGDANTIVINRSRQMQSTRNHAASVQHNPANASVSSMHVVPVATRRVCVRLCDGYQFPTESMSGDDELNAKLCQARCPDTEVRLYSVRDKDDLGAAEDRDGKPYRELASAFAFQKERDATCSCRKRENFGKMASPLDDPTLKRGDIVMVGTGARVFEGTTKAAHAAKDFVDIANAKALPKEFRQKMLTLLEHDAPVRAGGRRGSATTQVAARKDRPASEPASTWLAQSAVAGPGKLRIILNSPFEKSGTDGLRPDDVPAYVPEASISHVGAAEQPQAEQAQSREEKGGNVFRGLEQPRADARVTTTASIAAGTAANR